MNLSRFLAWPRTLFMRLTLIMLAGVTSAQGLSLWQTMYERDEMATAAMAGCGDRGVANSAAVLGIVTPANYEGRLRRRAHHTYGFILGPGESDAPPKTKVAMLINVAIEPPLGSRYAGGGNALPGDREQLQRYPHIVEGSPLKKVGFCAEFPASGRLALVVMAQFTLLAGCCWIAVRLATRPLSELEHAADTLGPDLSAERMSEDGPAEVAGAAKAFNAMQERIGGYMKERIQILAAISHDLQTPITRMRIRADLMEDDCERSKLQQDLKQMESLVREGVAYARTLHGAIEVERRVDPDAFMESLIGDYGDAGDLVSLTGHVGRTLFVRPYALRRVLGNLIDNAIKFSGSAEVRIESTGGTGMAVSVLDRGSGIPDELLDAVFQPFYRVESSSNGRVGGTGLGLAIAKQLAEAMNASLTLRNRDGGGLEACLTLNCKPDCGHSLLGLTQKTAPERGNKMLRNDVNPKRRGVS